MMTPAKQPTRQARWPLLPIGEHKLFEHALSGPRLISARFPNAFEVRLDLGRRDRFKKFADSRSIWHARRDRHPAHFRLFGRFQGMGIAVDHPQIGKSPELEESGPLRVAVLAPNLEERHLVIDLGIAPKSLAALGTTTALHSLEHGRLVAWRVP